jgi:hypothetical protein
MRCLATWASFVQHARVLRYQLRKLNYSVTRNHPKYVSCRSYPSNKEHQNNRYSIPACKHSAGFRLTVTELWAGLRSHELLPR